MELKCKSCGAALKVQGSGSTLIECTYCGTSNVVEQEAAPALDKYSRAYIVTLAKAIGKRFTEEELRELIFEFNGALPAGMSLSYDALKGGSTPTKSRELVLWCNRRMLIDELDETLARVRPGWTLDG